MVLEIAQPAAETKNNKAEITIAFFLPKASLIHPATRTPKMDPIKAELTYQPWVTAFKLNCSVTIPMVPEITAVDRKSTRLNSSHVKISYAVFCLKKKRTI